MKAEQCGQQGRGPRFLWRGGDFGGGCNVVTRLTESGLLSMYGKEMLKRGKGSREGTEHH